MAGHHPPMPPSLDSLETAALFGGSPIPAIFYGISVTIIWNCFHQIFQSQRRIPRWISIYLIVTLILSTVALAVYSFYATAKTYADNGNVYPWNALVKLSRRPIYVAGTACCFVLSWLSDALLLHRIYSIYLRNVWACLIPGLLLLSTIASGVAFVTIGVMNHRPNLSKQIGIFHWSIATVYSAVATAIIVMRLVRVRAQVSPTSAAAPYTSIIALTVESSTLYTACILVFLIGFATGNNLRLYLYPSIVMIHAISSLLILQRIISNLTVIIEEASTTTNNDCDTQVRLSEYQRRSIDSGESHGGGDFPLQNIIVKPQ